jgi:hypothetical protein
MQLPRVRKRKHSYHPLYLRDKGKKCREELAFWSEAVASDRGKQTNQAAARNLTSAPPGLHPLTRACHWQNPVRNQRVARHGGASL